MIPNHDPQNPDQAQSVALNDGFLMISSFNVNHATCFRRIGNFIRM